MTEIKNVIFDLGGVLIDWNPEYVYLEVFLNALNFNVWFARKKRNWFKNFAATMQEQSCSNAKWYEFKPSHGAVLELEDLNASVPN